MWKVRWNDIDLPIDPIAQSHKDDDTNNKKENQLQGIIKSREKQAQHLISSISPVLAFKRTYKQKANNLSPHIDTTTSDVRKKRKTYVL